MPLPANDLDIIRPLAAEEELYFKLSLSDQFHPTLCAHVNGKTTPKQWRDALDALQQRHALLRVSIEMPDGNLSGPKQPYLRRNNDKQIPLIVKPYTSDLRWEAEVEREQALPFPPGVAPPARAVLIHDSERSIFAFSMAHPVCDGVSLSYMIRDVLTSVAGQRLDVLDLPRSAEQLLHLPPAIPAQPVLDQKLGGKYINESPSIKSLRLTKDFTSRLLTVSRREETTVHSALAAAVILAMREQTPRYSHDPVRLVSPINIRSQLGVGEECCVYFVVAITSFDPTQSSFWEIARSTRQDVVNSSTMEAIEARALRIQEVTRSGLTKEMAAYLLDEPLGCDVIITNLGRTPYGSTFGYL